jgi:NTE family protein
MNSPPSPKPGRSRPELLGPVRTIPGDEDRGPPEGTALCLSGGGYRAMLFHVGVLRRLNEAGILPNLDRISSVSGGSIAAGVLGLAWKELERDGFTAKAFLERVEAPIRELASHDHLDLESIVKGFFLPGSISDKLADTYRDRLFGKATLQDLPENKPQLIINATTIDSGELALVSRAYLSDHRVGWIENPEIELAVAVACSSAFPPVLSPHRLKLAGAPWQSDRWTDLKEPEHREQLFLTDGGVYDNLGLETAWKRCETVIVSDAGGHMPDDADPALDWARHTLRVLKVIDNQVRALRKLQVIEGFKRGDRTGVYLGIRSDIADYHEPDALPAPHELTLELAAIPTRLDKMDRVVQERLINWGYAISDAGVKKHLETTKPPPPAALPYSSSGLG